MATFENAQAVTSMINAGYKMLVNPNTKKIFIADPAGNAVGGCSNKIVGEAKKTGINPDWVISEFTPEDGEMFLLLHAKGEGGATELKLSVPAKASKVDKF